MCGKGFDTYAEFKQAQAANGQRGTTPKDLYRGEEFITRLTDSNFDDKVRATNTEGETMYWLLNFYAPWCSHCVQASPKYKIVAEQFDGIVEFGAVNCEVSC